MGLSIFKSDLMAKEVGNWEKELPFNNREKIVIVIQVENDVITHWDIEGLENPSSMQNTQNTHTGSSRPLVDDTTNHEMIIKDFIDAINTGKEPLITGESAKNAT